jgi:2-polyprenyl-3-methyl-5-hydroxy-6-metoxy-1,4-benzoquinol methylase
MTNDYIYQQTVAGLSHESDNDRWSEGQKRFVSYMRDFMEPGSSVFDCACGDGVALRELALLGHPVLGMDMAESKLEKAGDSARFGDMHKAEDYPTKQFQNVLSSHTLEHAHDPSVVVENFYKILKPSGFLFVVLPFPDPGNWNDDIHVGKYILGTDGDDEDMVISFFTSRGFELVDKKRDDYREPELWMVLRKVDPQ